MRTPYWSVAAFTLATSLTVGVADAKKPIQKVNFNPNTQHCHFDKPSPRRDWPWKNARLTVVFVRAADGHYTVDNILNKKNIDEKLPIASLTKLMTTAVVFDAIDSGRLKPNQMIEVLPESYCLPDNDFATRYLQKGLKQISVNDALNHVIRLSSNTMAINLAIAVAGSEAEFVKLMNAKAAEWGMKNTHFINPHGLPEGDRTSEHTTAEDMITMAVHLLPYHDRLLQYETKPLSHWTVKEKRPAYKVALDQLEAFFKTATIDDCASLITTHEDGNTALIDVQLCSTTWQRFTNAISLLKEKLKHPDPKPQPTPSPAQSAPQVLTLIP